MTPSPFRRHQAAVGYLHLTIATHVRDRRLGRVYLAPFDIVFSRHDVLEPDLMFLGNERLGHVTEKNVQGPPDLVIEVLSESTEDRDREIKRRIYGKFGVREYWMVDPEAREVTIVEFPEDRERVVRVGAAVESALLPGLRVDLEGLFAAE